MKYGLSRGLTRWALCASVAVGALLITTDAHAIDVASETDWNAAAAAVTAAGAGTTVSINFTGGFTLTSSLALLQAGNANVTVNITGNGQTVNGASAFQGIQVSGTNAPTVNISSLTVTNAAALGGAGGAGQDGFFSGGLAYGSGGGGGGGLGAGGALYVGSGAKVTISGATFTNNSATGGTGGNGGVAQNTASSPTGGNGGDGGALNGAGAVGGGGAGGLGGNTGTQGTAGTAGSTTGAGGGGGGGSGTTASTAYTPNNNGGAGSANAGNGAQGGDGVTNNNGSQGPGSDGGSGGNGGAGQGGAIYVASGATLTVLDTPISGSVVAGGAGGAQGVGQGPSSFSGSPGGTGAAAGAGIYLNGVNANVGVTTGTVTYANSIGGTGLNSGGTTTALTKTGTGTLALTATNTFSGDIDINAGTVSVASTANLGNVNNSVVINSGGAFGVTADATFASGHAFKLTGAAGIDIATGTTTTIQGAVSGIGILDKTGAGTLVLNGATTYSGGTVVDAGILRLGTGVTLATADLMVNGGTFDLNNNNQTVTSLLGTGGTIALGTATLTDTQTPQTTYAGVITGTGGLTLNGTNILTLNGINTYTGATTLTMGSLLVGDASSPTASLASAVTLTSANVALGGYGTVASIANSGAVVPGGIPGTIGTLRVTGNFSQSSTGKTIIEVSPATAAKLMVGGTASLNGTLVLVYDPGTYTAKTYNIVNAGSVSGTYSTVATTGSTPSITQSIAYTATDVNLVLGGATVPTNTGILGDISSLALNDFYLSDDGVFDHLDTMAQGTDSVKNALAGATPMKIASNGSFQQLAQLGSQLPNAMAQYGGWVRGIGAFQDAGSQGSTAGYSASGGGFLAGLDHAFGPLTIGAAAGYSGTNIKQKDGSTGDIQTPRVMAYARYHVSPQIVLDGIAGFAYDSIHTTRPITALGMNATESHSATEENVALQAGYVMPWQGFTIVPRVGVQYVHLAEDGYHETGASGFNLNAPSRTLDSFQPVLSFTALKAFTLDSGMRITPALKVSYSHELLGTSQTLALTTPTGSAVAGTTLTPAHNTVTIGPEITAQLNQQLSLYGDYKAVIGIGKSLDNVIFAGARYAF